MMLAGSFFGNCSSSKIWPWRTGLEDLIAGCSAAALTSEELSKIAPTPAIKSIIHVDFDMPIADYLWLLAQVFV
jgi:hypothetical protein